MIKRYYTSPQCTILRLDTEQALLTSSRTGHFDAGKNDYYEGDEWNDIEFRPI